MLHAKWIYGITAILIMLGGIFSEGAVDIAIQDTYYVIATFHVFLIIASIFLLFSLIEWIFERLKRSLNQTLSMIHYSISALCILTVLIMTQLDLNKADTYQDISIVDEFNKFESYGNYIEWGLIVILLLLVTQLLFLVNILRSLIIKKNRQ